jgi:hypothetical protein
MVLAALGFCVGVAGASTRRIDTKSNVHLTQRSSQTNQAERACEADGATVSTAMAAFVAQNPGLVPTMTALTAKAHGGPYLQNAPFNPAYYEFSISHGVLKVAVAKSLGPPTEYTTPAAYSGPQSCSGVRVLSGTLTFVRAIAACQADGATVATAMAAYLAQNGNKPSMGDLISSANGGPYLQNAPRNPKYYKYSIVGGALMLASVKSEGPPVTYAHPISYEGPASCGGI